MCYQLSLKNNRNTTILIASITSPSLINNVSSPDYCPHHILGSLLPASPSQLSASNHCDPLKPEVRWCYYSMWKTYPGTSLLSSLLSSLIFHITCSMPCDMLYIALLTLYFSINHPLQPLKFKFNKHGWHLEHSWYPNYIQINKWMNQPR